MTSKTRYELRVAEGAYYSNSLVGLLWQVFKHRTHHLLRGEGWND